MALVIRHAKRIFLRSIILSCVACLVLPYISTLFHKPQDFLKTCTECKVCVLIFSATFV